MKFIKYFTILLFLSLSSMAQAKPDFQALKSIPVQDLGRVKPFDSFARESLQLIYGRQKYKGKSASEVIFTWMLIPQEWDQLDIIEVSDHSVKKALQLEDKKMHFTPNSMIRNPRVGLLIKELQLKSDRKDKLNGFDQAIQRLNNQLTLYHAIRNGLAFRVVPQQDPMQSRWLSVAELQEPYKSAFQGITKAFAQSLAGDSDVLPRVVKDFVSLVEKDFGDYYDKNRLKAEVSLHNYQPFLIAAILYLLSAILLVIAWMSTKKVYYKSGLFFALVAFVVHTIGFLVRVYIIKRPPVSNMYETVIWAPWGTVLFGLILNKIHKKQIVLIAATFVAFLCLLMAQMAPTILDPSLQPLEAVLRSSFWLVTHVMLIVISYGAFFLSWAVGNYVLTLYLINPENLKQQIKDSAQIIYRSNQIGVVLLALGTILGGVWADYSWGRFWGWDPKETWAWIALVGYVARLHAKVSGLVRGFGMAAASVAAFSLVIMAWYGVNFWLGAGLHSYGFGAGGIQYVGVVVLIQLLYVAFVATYRKSKEIE